MSHLTLRTAFALIFASAALAPAATILFGPQAYRSEADSPFIRGIEEGTIYLEDFEDQQLNTPFVEEPTGLGLNGSTFRALVPTAVHGTVWSVDGDDGIINGEAWAGDTWVTDRSFAQFDFQPDILGRYPTFVGVVITHVGDLDRDVDVGFFGLEGGNVVSDAEFDPSLWGGTGRSALHHRFVGVYHEEGIQSMIVSNVRQVDHLQYGYAIPEPRAAMLSLLGLGIIWFRNRKVALGMR